MCERLDWNSSPKDDRTYLQRYIYIYISAYINTIALYMCLYNCFCTAQLYNCFVCVYTYMSVCVYIYTYIYKHTHIYIYTYIGINLPWPRIQSRGHIFPKEKVGDVVQVNAMEDEEAGLVESQPISATAGNWDPVTHACHSF